MFRMTLSLNTTSNWVCSKYITCTKPILHGPKRKCGHSRKDTDCPSEDGSMNDVILKSRGRPRKLPAAGPMTVEASACVFSFIHYLVVAS
jgi:hypothetical protein